MERKERTERILSLVNTIAMEAVELPPADRPAFIRARIADLREEADRPAWKPDTRGRIVAFADALEDWVEDAIEVIESSPVLADG